MNEKVEQKLREKIRTTIKDKLSEAISGADRKILFILIREIVRNLKPKIKNMDVDNKSHINRVGSSILGIIRAMTYTPDNANYKNFKKYFPKNFNNKLVQKKLKQFHSQNDKVQVTLVTQAIKNELSEGKLTEKIKPKQKISKKEWSKIKKFNKHIGQDGTHYVTQLDRKLGTILVPVIVEEKLDEKCQPGYKTHPTRKTKEMFGKRYRNCIKAEDIESLSEDKIYSKSDGLKKVKSVSKKGRVYKVDKQKAKFGGKNVTMYALYTKYKNHTSGQNPFGLDMARNSKGEAMYLVPIKEGTLTESQVAKTILQQLGGNKFIAMTGAKNFGSSRNSLQFKIGRNSKSISHVIVTLKSSDLYDVEFIRIRGTSRKVVKKLRGIYADQLQQMFTKYTGLRTRL